MSESYDRGPADEQEKPYDFVPMARARQRRTVGHERLRGPGYNTGRLDYQLRVLSPVFVASGSYALGGDDLPYTDEPVVRACYRVDGMPAIPGSTLKGVVRSVVEAVSPSCVGVTRERIHSQCQPDNACPACSMFGRLNRMAKVFFSDASLTRGRVALHHLPALYQPRIRGADHIYKDNGRFRGRKFYKHGQPASDDRQPPVEVLPPDSLLRGTVTFENLSDGGLGLLIFSLGLDSSFALKLGGGKPTCLGSVRIEPGGLALRGRNDFLQAEPDQGTLHQGEAMIDIMAARLQAARREKLILPPQREKLREILQYPSDRDCPEGNY